MGVQIDVTLSDRWYCLVRFGLRIGSPHVGMTRVELIGSVSQWEAARAYLASDMDTLRGANKTSVKMALRRIDAGLAWGRRAEVSK